MPTLYLIPTPLSEEETLQDVLSPAAAKKAISLTRFIVENERTARRLLSRSGLRGQIEGLRMYTVDEHSTQQEIESAMNIFEDGEDVGLMSEAGLPAVADPGAAVVALCHRRGIAVKPFAGPSSLMLTLMASGANGQSFAFNGYLPAKTAERHSALRELEKIAHSRSQSQIFIETPYRSDAMLQDCISTLSPDTILTLGIDISGTSETFSSRRPSAWKGFTIGKRPAVFIIS